MSLKDAHEARALIEAHSIPIPFAGCWMWLRSFHNGGYGQQWFGVGQDRRLYLVHRLSFEAFKGPIPAGMLIQHSCDNRWCCNPEHLSLGTDATNARDALLKGRTASPELDDVWIRDGALCDEDTLAAIADHAAAAKKRVWIERVGTADPGAIIIHDGRVAS